MLYAIIIGGIAGWLAGLVVKGRGSGILINIVLGIVGAFVGHFLLGVLDGNNGMVLGLQSNTIGADIISGTIGAIVVLLIARILSR